MSKYIDANLLRAEIERLEEKAAERISKAQSGDFHSHDYERVTYSRGELSALYDLGAFLDTLPEQPVVKKSNALFDKCVENCDPAIMKEVSDNIDKMLGRQPVEGLGDEAESYWIEAGWSKVMTLGRFKTIARHFAEWGRKQVLQEIYDGKVKPVDKITAAWLTDEQNA